MLDYQEWLRVQIIGRNNCIKIAKIHQKILFQRRDFFHKEATKLVEKYDIIALEDLQIKNMMQNHSLNKSINDVSWGMFRKFLTYKAEEREK